MRYCQILLDYFTMFVALIIINSIAVICAYDITLILAYNICFSMMYNESTQKQIYSTSILTIVLNKL